MWLQDVWRVAPTVQATLGGRYEWWRAYDGFNFSTGSNGVGVPINQPGVDKSAFSPKASVTWDATETWSVTGSFGKAYRFPTVGELYQSIQTGTTFVQANPFCNPSVSCPANWPSSTTTATARCVSRYSTSTCRTP
ncbi:TonB-dependent receptor domain-containing protein [Cupriavidus basilensis]